MSPSVFPSIRSVVLLLVFGGLSMFTCSLDLLAQDTSVKPGINDSFRDPDVQEFQKRFEVESREVYVHRNEIIAACAVQAGETVADIGAGTGLFTRLLSEKVGAPGQVLAVDISQKFLDHIQAKSRELGQSNVQTVLCQSDSTSLAKDSIDMALICDTYHHFEFPQKTMASLFQALKSGGRLVLVDFRRVEGKSSDWVMNHVRAGQEVFESEVAQAGFHKVFEAKEPFQENYLVIFKKP